MTQNQKRPPAKTAKQDLADLTKADKSNTKANDPRQQPGTKSTPKGLSPKK